MHFLGFLVLILWQQLSQAFPAPVDTIIVQIQQWGVVGTQQVMNQVLLNGVSLASTTPEINSIIQTMSADALVPSLISTNQTSALINHTILRSRECIMEGSQLHWTDRVFYDGKVLLTLNHSDAWTAHEPQALALKELWDQEAQRTRRERKRLQEGCIQLMKELRLSETHSVLQMNLPQFLIPILAVLIFSGLIIVSLLIIKNKGPRHPGGVIGSIIHYPRDMTETDPEKKDFTYQTL